MKQKNDNLYKYSVQKPWEFIIVTVMYVIGAVSFPPNTFSFIFGNSKNAELLSLFLIRALCCIIPIWLMISIRVNQFFTAKNLIGGLIVIIPFLLVAINNFPIVSLIQEKLRFEDSIGAVNWICYLLAVLGGVVLEEVCFRGLIFPTLLRKFKQNESGKAFFNANFKAVLYSSAIFGAVHIVNLLNGGGVGATFVQIGYSFLIGAMCAIAFLKTGNFYHTVLLHFIYNVGGLLSTHDMIVGKIWTVWQVVITAVLAIIVLLYAIYILQFKDNNKLLERLEK